MLLDWNNMMNQSTARGPKDKSTIKYTGLSWNTAKRILFELASYILNLTDGQGKRKRPLPETESVANNNKRYPT